MWVAGALEEDTHSFFGIRYPGEGRSLAFPAAKPGELASSIVPDGVLEFDPHHFLIDGTSEQLRDEAILEAEALEAFPIDTLSVKPRDFLDHAGCESVEKPYPDAFAEDFFWRIEDENHGVVFSG